MGIPLGLIDLDVPMVWSVEGLLSAQECASIRARADGIEWLEATVNTARGRAIRAEADRKNNRVHGFCLHGPGTGA
ncbi:MAG: hypothetical protein ACK6CU_05565 [Deltaproteobacteria bacterium]|jgi:hypothetical protein